MEEEEPLKEHIANYFFNIFSMAGNDNEEILRMARPKVTEEMNDVLCAEYREEEVNSLRQHR